VDIVPYLSAVILVTTIATILLAVLSYAAFKLRDKRKPKGNVEKPVFFHRYLPDDDDASFGIAGDDMEADQS
jgi:hypothetical protein